MARSIRRRGPRRVARIVRLKHDSTLPISQPHCAGAARQFIRVRADDVGDSINALHVRRHGRDDEISARRQHRVRRKSEINVPAQPKSADVFNVRVRIEQFDEFEVLPVHAVRGVIHDFRNDHRPMARRRPDRLRRRADEGDVQRRRIERECPLRVRQNDCRRGGAVADVVHRKRISCLRRHRCRREDDRSRVRAKCCRQHRHAVVDGVAARVGGAGRLDRLRKNHRENLRIAEAAHGGQSRRRHIRVHR